MVEAGALTEQEKKAFFEFTEESLAFLRKRYNVINRNTHGKNADLVSPRKRRKGPGELARF